MCRLNKLNYHLSAVGSTTHLGTQIYSSILLRMSEDADMGVEEEVRLPYSQQKLWSDVSPIHVDDGNCVASVQYSSEHREALSYFRAVLLTGEKTERVLRLTEDMIDLNQADYTAWQLR